MWVLEQSRSSLPSQSAEDAQNCGQPINMQEGTNSDIPPHHIIVFVEVPEDVRSQDFVARINVSQVSKGDK